MIIKRRFASDVDEVFLTETSNKDIEKAHRLLTEAMLILRKFEAALAVKKIKQKVNNETNNDIDGLIDVVDKATDKVLTYAIKLSVLKDKSG